MYSEISNKIIKETIQYLPNGTSISLTFHYPANFKIGDTIEVTARYEAMQLFVPQHEEGYFVFDIDVWDDQVRLYCDSMKELKIYNQTGAMFSFKIREIELFANTFAVAQKAELCN